MTDLEYKILEILSKKGTGSKIEIRTIINDDITISNSEKDGFSHSIDWLKQDGFIEYDSTANDPVSNYKIRNKGTEAYYHNKNIKDRETEEREIKFEKMKVELRISKLTYRTYWVMFFMSVAALILSLLSLLLK